MKCRTSFRFKQFGTRRPLGLQLDTKLLIWFLNLFQRHLMQHRDKGVYGSGSPDFSLLVVDVEV